MPRVWERDETWTLRPSRDELASAARLITRLVEPYGGPATFSAEARVTEPASKVSADTLDEFLTELAEHDMAELEDVSVRIRTHITQADMFNPPVRASITISRTWDKSPKMRVGVSGTNRTAVEGVFAQLKERFDAALADREREAAVAAEEAQRADETKAQQAALASPLPAGVQRQRWWQHNPLFVTIVGGIIAAVIAGVVLALLLGT